MRKEAFRFQQVLNILIYILTAGLLGLAFYSVLMKYVDVILKYCMILIQNITLILLKLI